MNTAQHGLMFQNSDQCFAFLIGNGTSDITFGGYWKLN